MLSEANSSSPDKTIRFVGRMTLPYHNRFMYIYMTAHFKYNINEHNEYGKHNRYGTVYYSKSSPRYFQYLYKDDKYLKNKPDVTNQFSSLTFQEILFGTDENGKPYRPPQPKDYDWETI